MAVDAFAEDVLADNPIGYWRLGERPGQPAADSSPNGNNGTYNGGITLGQRLRPLLGGDTAALFDGATGDRRPAADRREGELREHDAVRPERAAGRGHVFVELRCPIAGSDFNAAVATSTWTSSSPSATGGPPSPIRPEGRVRSKA
jgi:hypothetical protein